MNASRWDKEIRVAAVKYSLSPELVRAIVTVETDGNPWAWNPEPRYSFLWDVRSWAPFRRLLPPEVMSEVPPPDFYSLAGDRDQEWWGQQASWGLMQVMGAVARERGFRGPYLTQLLEPATSLDVGCCHLAKLLTRAVGDQERAIGAYNAGFGEWDSAAARVYRDKVLRELRG